MSSQIDRIPARMLRMQNSKGRDVDLQTIINIVLGSVMGALGWFARELWDAVKELKTDVSKLREDLPKTYVAKEDWRPEMQEIKHILGKIFDKLDGKADK